MYIYSYHSVCHRRNISPFLRCIIIWPIQTIYFLKAHDSHYLPELRNINSLTEMKSVKPNLPPRNEFKLRQLYYKSNAKKMKLRYINFYPNFQIFLHKYICHICEVSHFCYPQTHCTMQLSPCKSGN